MLVFVLNASAADIVRAQRSLVVYMKRDFRVPKVHRQALVEWMVVHATLMATSALIFHCPLLRSLHYTMAFTRTTDKTTT